MAAKQLQTAMPDTSALAAEAGRGAERVGVVDDAAPHVGDGLEPAVRVLREAGHLGAVVHPPAVDAGDRDEGPRRVVAR